VSGKYQQRTYPNYYIVDNSPNTEYYRRKYAVDCSNVKMPSSSSDVPGPIINLYEDVNVPLYNYNNTIDTNYGELTQNPYSGKDTWTSNIISNVQLIKNSNNANKLNAIIASIYIYYADVPYKTFSITTPILLQIDGSRIQTQDSSMNFIISNISTNILFNNSPINYSANTITNTINNNSSQTFNISISSNSFSRTFYLGLLKITNIKLPFQKGFIFDIQPEITFSTSSNVTITSTTIICNVDPTPTNLNNKFYQTTRITAT
jgi:hypothetical protein